MYLKIKNILKLDIVKVFSLTSISTFFQMLASFISVKVIAVIIGPAGIALLGQLNNFSAIIMSFATGGINIGVTKYVAESKENKEQLKDLIATAAKIILTLSIIIGISVIFTSKFLSKKILLDIQYYYVYIIFGIALVFNACNSLLLSIVNGFKHFKIYIKVSICSSIIGLIISLLLVFFFGLNGALISAVTSQSLLFFIVLLIIKKEDFFWLNRQYFLSEFKKIIAKKYFKYTLMALTSALTVPASQLLIRTYLIKTFSIQQAGYWEAMNKLSNMYLNIIISSFSIYYLPRLSELVDSAAIKKELRIAYKVVIPLLIILLPSIYLFRRLIITIVFSIDFSAMESLFFGQLLGDFFKITSWLIAYLMVAKGMTKLFITSEIIFSATFIGLMYFFCSLFELQGVVIGYAMNYGLYLIFTIWIVLKRI